MTMAGSRREVKRPVILRIPGKGLLKQLLGLRVPEEVELPNRQRDLDAASFLFLPHRETIRHRYGKRQVKTISVKRRQMVQPLQVYVLITQTHSKNMGRVVGVMLDPLDVAIPIAEISKCVRIIHMLLPHSFYNSERSLSRSVS